MNLNGLKRIRRTARVVPAARRHPRGNVPAIKTNERMKEAGERSHEPASSPRCLTLASARSRSIPSSRLLAPRAGGKTRMTHRSPGVRAETRSRMRWRRRRSTRLRTTALPTVLGTTKPTNAGAWSASHEPGATCIMRLFARPRCPRRIVSRKSPDLRIRCCAGSNAQAESFARPLRRRDERMLRPARVAIRLRKP